MLVVELHNVWSMNIYLKLLSDNVTGYIGL